MKKTIQVKRVIADESVQDIDPQQLVSKRTHIRTYRKILGDDTEIMRSVENIIGLYRSCISRRLRRYITFCHTIPEQLVAFIKVYTSSGNNCISSRFVTFNTHAKINIAAVNLNEFFGKYNTTRLLGIGEITKHMLFGAICESSLSSDSRYTCKKLTLVMNVGYVPQEIIRTISYDDMYDTIKCPGFSGSEDEYTTMFNINE